MGRSLEEAWTQRGWRAWAMSPLGAFYACGWWSYQGVYALGIKQAYRPKVPVVTVGNLIAGGAGKTPLTMYVARLLMDSGRNVVVSLSGYGFPKAQSATLAPEGDLDPQEWGDEPALVREALPDVAIVVGRDRVKASQIVEQTHPGSILLMDDGFQHLRLAQCVTLVLDPETGNHFCLPAGPYREPRSTGLRRADLVLPSQEFRVETEFVLKERSGGVAKVPTQVQVLTAIARPERVVHSLSALGVDVVRHCFLPDHDTLQAGTLLDVFNGQAPLVVTAKDYVKLRSRPDLADREVLVASTVARVAPEPGFRAWLMGKLNETGW